MPGLDGTGPRGRGPLTGRGMGNCTIPTEEYERLQNEQTLPRRRFGRGFGRGCGWRHRHGQG